MAVNGDRIYRGLLNEISRVGKNIDGKSGNPGKTLERVQALKAKCVERGIRSAHVSWQLAIAADYAGDFETACASIREAVEIDPLAPSAWTSYQIIIERMQRTFMDTSIAADEPILARLYELLLECNEASDVCHLAKARQYRATGRSEEALELLAALTKLHPAFADGWEELIKLAGELDRPEIVEGAKRESLARLGGSSSRFLPNVPHARA